MLHLLFVSPVQRYIGYLVESDEVDPAVQRTQQLYYLLEMCRSIIGPAEDSVFECQAALVGCPFLSVRCGMSVGREILLQQADNLAYPHAFLCRHEPFALSRERCVE